MGVCYILAGRIFSTRHITCDWPTAGHLHKVRDMLKEKPSLSTIEGKDGATPLMFASNKGHKEVSELKPSITIFISM